MVPDVFKTTYLVYLRPGSFVPNESRSEVDVRDPQLHANVAPSDAFAFYYYDIITATVEFEGQNVETTSVALNRSVRYYIDAVLLTSREVAALPGDHRALLDNMRFNGWDPIARCRTGNYQPFKVGEYELITTR